MLKYEFINKDWIISRKARLVYRFAAMLALTLIPVLAVFRRTQIPEGMLPFARLLLFAGVVGTALTEVGMQYFLFRFDDSHPVKQVFWFCVMLFPPLGPALYCFTVYSRSKVLAEVANGAAKAHPL